jgi:hypothetical protein
LLATRIPRGLLRATKVALKILAKVGKIEVLRCLYNLRSICRGFRVV